MDVETYPDLDVTGREITDDDAAIIEALRRGLSQPPGTLDYDPAQGFDLRALLSRQLGPGDVSLISGRVEAQAKRDERIARARATVEWSPATERLSGRLWLQRRDGRELRLTVAATALSLTLLRET